MSDAIIQPSGKILLFNGGSYGRTGGAIGLPDIKAEALDVFQYDPYVADGQRWKVLARTPIRRLYHSSTVLLPDGRISIQGTDQAVYVRTGGEPYEHRVETFTPPWLLDGSARPAISASPASVTYQATFTINYTGPFTRVSLMAPNSGSHGTS